MKALLLIDCYDVVLLKGGWWSFGKSSIHEVYNIYSSFCFTYGVFNWARLTLLESKPSRFILVTSVGRYQETLLF